MSIAPINSVLGGVARTAQASGPGERFSKLLGGEVAAVNAQQLEAGNAIQGLITGETDNVHDVVLSVAKADLSFRLLLEIRNRLMENYQEIMRMQV